MSELIAAGAVLWRRSGEGVIELAVVHRPHYDDWSWPKGKPHAGESLPVTAVREVAEETGHTAVLGCRLASVDYPVAAGQKVAHYWSARSAGGRFTPTEEVDQMRWVPAEEVADLLSYPHDRTPLADLDRVTDVTTRVLLIRHAKAGHRAEWHGDDTRRPLSTAGWRQVTALRTLLPLFGAQRVYSAPRTRCRQTVEGLAADLAVPVVDEPLMSEENYRADPQACLRRLTEIAAGSGTAAVCSQGGVIPDMVNRLAADHGLVLPDAHPSRKGSFWVLSFGGTRVLPVLRAADYYD